MSIETPLPARVAAIVVTHNPDLPRLRQALEALEPQVAHVFVVDNGSGSSFEHSGASDARVTFIGLDENRGIAAAQNVGSRAAIAAGAEFVLLMDQDSVAAPDMVIRLIAGWYALAAAGYRIAAVGPCIIGRNGSSGFVRFGWIRYRAAHAGQREQWVPCDMLIASGSLISVDVLTQIGGMDEGLFIDKVDTEWCLRATARGLMLAGVPAARLEHAFGHEERRVWVFGWRRFSVNQPFRYYYIFRNSVSLRRLPHATARWRRVDTVECLKYLVYLGVLGDRRWENLKMMARGLVDGLRGVSGPLRR